MKPLKVWDPMVAGDGEVAAPEGAAPRFDKGAYFIGKAVWGKGYTELLQHMAAQKEIDGSALHMNIYGHGEDVDAVRAAVRCAPCRTQVHCWPAAEHCRGREMCCNSSHVDPMRQAWA